MEDLRILEIGVLIFCEIDEVSVLCGIEAIEGVRQVCIVFGLVFIGGSQLVEISCRKAYAVLHHG